MARQHGALTFNNINTTTTTKTVARIGTVDTPIVVRAPEITFKGTSPTAAKILVEFIKGSQGGTATAKAPANKGVSSIPITNVGGEIDFTVEPTTTGTVIASVEVHPQHGYTYPGEIELQPLEQLSIRVTAVDAVGCSGHMQFEK